MKHTPPPAFVNDDAPPQGQSYWAADAWLRRHDPRLVVERRRYPATWGEPRYFEHRPEPVLFTPADIETRRAWLHVPGGRPLTDEEKHRDLFALIGCGRSILDPPPSQGATKPSTPRLADAAGIRAQYPLNTRPDRLAMDVVEKIDPEERAARIEHLDMHGMCASRLWKNTHKPGEMFGLSDAPAPGETEIVAPARSTFDYQHPDERAQRRYAFTTPQVAVGPLRFGRAYSYWSNSRLPNNRGPMFRSAKKPKPLKGTHSDPRQDLVAWARRCRLSRHDERQLWARHLAGDESARRKLINSCASKCLAFVHHRLDQHERWDGFHVLLDEVAKIVDARKFDPSNASLPAFVDKMLGWRIKDIRRRIRFREKLMVPTDFTGRLEFDEDTGKIIGDVVRAMAESVAEADVEDGDDEVEAEARADRQLDQLLGLAEDETDRLIIQLRATDRTQTEVADELKVSQSKVSRRLGRLKIKYGAAA